MAFTHPARDQLSVLSAEVNHQNGVETTGTLVALLLGP